MRRLWFWILLVFAVAATLFGVDCFYEARRINADLDEKEAYELARVDVDLSGPGRYAIELDHTLDVAHDNPIVLELQCDADNLTGALTPLAAKVIIGTPDGKTRDPEAMKGEDFRVGSRRRYPGWGRIPLGKQGTCHLVLDVTQGAPMLKGHAQTLVVRYNVCRLADLLATVVRIIGAVSLALGAAVWVYLFYRRRRLRSATDPSSTSTAAPGSGTVS